MMVILGVVGMAVLFGVFTVVGRSDKGCNGQCIGCTRGKACASKGGRP